MFQGMQYVYEVYKERSFSKAAQNLYISQPSLSATVKKIETRIGAPIFDRSTSPVRLTECGQEYIKCIEKILDIQKQIRENAPSTFEVAPTKQETEQEAQPDKKKENSPLIYGRSATIKENTIKIIDITPEEGRVAIEGELSNIETKELRSGKILVSFDLYDGSSSMTCKVFLKPEQSVQVIDKLKAAKGVKLLGNAGYSNFSGEVELIANVIVQTNGLRRIKRMDKNKWYSYK